jgi:hypothetical protein
VARLTLALTVFGFVAVLGSAGVAAEQIRSRASGPAPAPPKPVVPAPGFPLRGSTLSVFPVFWGWGTLPYYVASVSTPLTEGPTGGVQLDVQPWRARVFVDGAYAGRVEDFKGYYEHLEVVAGPHQITIVEPGFLPLVFDIIVAPGRTTTCRGTLNTSLN